MPLIWCSISGHGFGHGAQVVPVLNALGRKIPGLTVVLRTTVPSWFFEGRLTVKWTHSAVEQDIGCAQRGPLLIDCHETWERHLRFQADWEQRVAEEERAIRLKRPELVLSDISWLAIEAGVRARVPAVGLSNLSWDQVLTPYLDPGREDQRAVLEQIRHVYGRADLMIRLAPGLALPAFRHITDVGAVAQEVSSGEPRLRNLLPAPAGDRIVLVGFGGVALESLPFEQMERMDGYRFIVDGPIPSRSTRVHSVSTIPLPFIRLLAEADVIMTKPGYSTIVEAVARHRPVVYVRRYTFADEEPLVRYLHRYGRGVELPAPDFHAGRWREALDALWTLPRSGEPAPPPTGAAEAADILARHL